jgi:hypothetical protein
MHGLAVFALHTRICVELGTVCVPFVFVRVGVGAVEEWVYVGFVSHLSCAVGDSRYITSGTCMLCGAVLHRPPQLAQRLNTRDWDFTVT